jgi:hypothetical protein
MLVLAAMAGAAAALSSGSNVRPTWLGIAAVLLAVALVVSGLGYLLASATLQSGAYASLPLLLLWCARPA